MGHYNFSAISQKKFLKRLASACVLYSAFLGLAAFIHTEFGAQSADPLSLKIAGGAIGLLLALVLNIGYSRWEQAATILGKLHSDSVNIACVGLFNTKMDENWNQRFLALVSCFSLTFKNSLLIDKLEEDKELQEYRRFLSREEAREIVTAKYKSEHVGRKISQMAQEALNSDAMIGDVYSALEAYRGSMLEGEVKAKGLSSFPFPSAVGNLAAGFILIFLGFVPFALLRAFDWLGLIYALVLAFTLLAFFMTGADLCRPFSSNSASYLSLDEFAKSVGDSVFDIGN